jgi:hypothetical protein
LEQPHLSGTDFSKLSKTSFSNCSEFDIFLILQNYGTRLTLRIFLRMAGNLALGSGVTIPPPLFKNTFRPIYRLPPRPRPPPPRLPLPPGLFDCDGLAELFDEDGEADGFVDGEVEGFADGEADGFADGEAEGFVDGEVDGFVDGEADGAFEGLVEGCVVALLPPVLAGLLPVCPPVLVGLLPLLLPVFEGLLPL